MNENITKSVFIHRANKASGPFTRKQIRNGLATGKLKLTDSFSFGREGKHKQLKDFYLSTNITYTLNTSWGLKRHSVRYSCPHCDVKLRSKLKEAGSTESCPDCGTIFIVPGENDKTQLLGETGKSTSVENAEIEENQQSIAKQDTDQHFETFQDWLVHQNLDIEELKVEALAQQKREWNTHNAKYRKDASSNEKKSDAIIDAVSCTAVGIFSLAILVIVLYFMGSSVEYLRGWLPEGTSLSRTSFAAGVVIAIAPLAMLLTVSPILFVIVIIVDDKLLEGSVTNAFVGLFLICMGIGAVLMLLAIPIWLIELFV